MANTLKTTASLTDQIDFDGEMSPQNQDSGLNNQQSPIPAAFTSTKSLQLDAMAVPTLVTPDDLWNLLQAAGTHLTLTNYWQQATSLKPAVVAEMSIHPDLMSTNKNPTPPNAGVDPSSSPASTTNPSIPKTPNNVETLSRPGTKRKAALDRNRMAASKSRAKKKAWIVGLQTQVEEMEEQNKVLNREMVKLQNKVTELENLAAMHVFQGCCGIDLPISPVSMSTNDFKQVEEERKDSLMELDKEVGESSTYFSMVDLDPNLDVLSEFDDSIMRWD